MTEAMTPVRASPWRQAALLALSALSGCTLHIVGSEGQNITGIWEGPELGAVLPFGWRFDIEDTLDGLDGTYGVFAFETIPDEYDGVFTFETLPDETGPISGSRDVRHVSLRISGREYSGSFAGIVADTLMSGTLRYTYDGTQYGPYGLMLTRK